MVQKESPAKVDFFCLVLNDFELIGEPMDENEIASKSSKCHKNYIKQRIREAAFGYLQEKQQSHSKIKEIQYQNLETQNYMKSSLFNNSEVSILFALRSRYVD